MRAEGTAGERQPAEAKDLGRNCLCRERNREDAVCRGGNVPSGRECEEEIQKEKEKGFG